MIKLENTEVIGWEAAIRGMRNPMNSWAKSDSGWDAHIPPIELRNQVDWKQWAEHYKTVQYSDEYTYDIGPNDYNLMTRLAKTGTDHRKFMRMIAVYVDITAPLYWWKEFDTYKVGTVADSCSTMHKIAAKEFTLDDFSHEHLIDYYQYYCNEVEGPVINDAPHISCGGLQLLQLTINVLNYYRNEYNIASDKLKRTDLTEAERKHTLAQQKLYWWQMIQLLPSSYNQRRTVMLNYEVLANIYKSRKDHKLDEWRLHEIPEEHAFRNKDFSSGMWGFCDWIESLPCSELITGIAK